MAVGYRLVRHPLWRDGYAVSRDNSIMDVQGMARLQRDLKRSRMKYSRGGSGVRVKRGIQGTTIRIVAGRGGGSASSDKSRWKLTRTSGSAVVTVGPGSVLKGSWIECAETSVTVGGGSEASPHYIYATINLNSNTAAIAANTIASKPTSTATEMKIVLHTVYRSGSSVAHLYQNQSSDIILDKAYA